MASWGKVDFKQLKKLQQQIEKLQKAEMERFCKAVSKELAARLLGKVIARTPVGQYPANSGKVGGTLRRGWTGEKQQSAAVYAQSLPVKESGNTYEITIINPPHRRRISPPCTKARTIACSSAAIFPTATAIITTSLKETASPFTPLFLWIQARTSAPSTLPGTKIR